ncbi:glycoside hydrolase family 15 protein, partial [Kitasatospora sp. NPDC057542]|uniref:glycoside hydrolase family 15 protein n=1 Tax=Kitasatospora sp. NPDC057542 TaxID=3346162 RepID=UPI0036BE4228
MQTAALVSRDGTVDWLCAPRFDSPAVFASLLGTDDHGSWNLAPATYHPRPADRRRYQGDSLILEQEWDTQGGTVRVTDFMPTSARAGADPVPRIIRIVECLTGTVTMRSVLRPRFGYGRTTPAVHRPQPDPCGPHRLAAAAVAGPDAVWLDSPHHHTDTNGTLTAEFTARAGERTAYALTYRESHRGAPPTVDTDHELARTERFWRDWADQCTYQGPYREAVIRSLITLKGLTYAPTGGIVAAPTTSLPEDIGGVRNWDYRYTWLRDAAITLSSLLRTGYREEARAWREWLLRAVAGDPENLQIMYGIAGERELTESSLDWLPGYEDSQPVRVGNGAAGQLQLDVYGEIVEALHLGHMTGLVRNDHAHHLQLRLIEYLEDHWQNPDEGIWEVRGPRRHFVHSKV